MNRRPVSGFRRQTALVVCLFACLAAGHECAAQSRHRPEPKYLQIGKPDQAEGAKILRDFRSRRIDGDYYLQFILRVMPRRGDGPRIPGRLWGSQNALGPITRVEMGATKPADIERFLVQGGATPRAWEAHGGGEKAPIAVDPAALFAPLAGTNLTMFEVQMPFLYWSDYVFEGVDRLRGRPADVFLMYPPDDIAKERPDLTGVRIYLDTQFGALVQAEQIGENDKPIKTLSVLELKKIGERWMVKTIDLRNDLTRDKTRFTVTDAALGLKLPAEDFAPASLAGPAAPPAKDLLTNIED